MTKKKSSPPVRRSDRPGHLDPTYAASLLARGTARETEDFAFVRGRGTKDELAQELAREAVITMTSGEDALTDDREKPTDEERGGPFVTSTARTEFAHGVDASNPVDAFREPFPKT